MKLWVMEKKIIRGGIGGREDGRIEREVLHCSGGKKD